MDLTLHLIARKNRLQSLPQFLIDLPAVIFTHVVSAGRAFVQLLRELLHLLGSTPARLNVSHSSLLRFPQSLFIHRVLGALLLIGAQILLHSDEVVHR